jgi:hypothetical protein
MHLATVACIVRRAVPIQGVKLLPLEEEMQVVLAIGDVSTMEHDGTALTKIERSPALDEVAADKVSSVSIRAVEVVENVRQLLTIGGRGHSFSELPVARSLAHQSLERETGAALLGRGGFRLPES